jgi:hypothetical protein
MLIAASNTLPDNAGYVAAAYLVFLALLVIYVGIMAYKLVKVQRDVTEINELADRALGHDPATEAREREETPA